MDITEIKNGEGEIVMTIQDSGEKRTFETGAVRDKAEGKGRCDLLPMCALLRLARHYEAGGKKYGDRNWEKGQPISALMDSGLRHMFKYLDGWTDEDHLAAAAWNILGAMWMEEKRPAMQDIDSRIQAGLEWLRNEERACSENKEDFPNNGYITDINQIDDFIPVDLIRQIEHELGYAIPVYHTGSDKDIMERKTKYIKDTVISTIRLNKTHEDSISNNNAQECLNKLAEVLLGKDYFLVYPYTTNQVNDIILKDIIDGISGKLTNIYKSLK